LKTLAVVALAPLFVVAAASDGEPPDRLKALQTAYVANRGEKAARAYHFGSQGAGDVFSNHASHTNRMVPVYVFGRKADLGAVMGEHSRYRDPGKIQAAYGFLPEHTVNPGAVYADQSDLYRVQKEAIARGVKHLFIVWFDGLDWPTTQAAAIVKTGKVYRDGEGSGLIFQDYQAGGAAQYGFVVTSPTHDKNTPDVDAQSVVIPPESLGGGYDARIAGPNPWTLGPLGERAPGYLKGQSANAADKAGVQAVGGVLHAYTDSSQSAGEMISGVKSYNNGVNVTDSGRPVKTLFHELQEQGWKLGTVTSVPFNHVSPAVMYAWDVDRDDYQDLAREMLGLPSVFQQARGVPSLPGLDVVMGVGYGITSQATTMAPQGKNWVPGNTFIADPDLAAIDVKNGGKYVVVHTQRLANGAEALARAAKEAAGRSARLFGFFGRAGLDHLPYRTADGRYDPAPSLGRKGEAAKPEVYPPTDRLEQPTLAQMTEAALTVLAARPDQPFALFVEAGDVDFALHANNLDNAIGAIYSGEEAMRAVIGWVEAHSNWDESLLLVSSDHGHYLVLDDPQALIDSPQAAADATPDRAGQEFALRVVGPDGKPVPEARVELRSHPGPKIERIRQGRLIRQGAYGTFVAADEQGQLAVEIPGAPRSFDVFIETSGYGPYWAGWSSEGHAQSIPARFTAELEASWSVGGIVVDAAGKPVEGVTVSPRIEFKKRPGVHQQMGVGAQRKTDAAGKWHYDSVPASLSEVFAEINHPGFRPLRRALTRAEFGLERGRQPAAKIVMERGLTVAGKVTDEAGKPIAGALVRTRFQNDRREARTGPDGVYQLAGCEPRTVRIVVSAKGRAMDMKEVRIEPEMRPVDFAMKPGGTVRVRVLDHQGKPVPRSRIFFQQWRGRIDYFEFNHVSQYADENGVWVWNEAPLDEFKADICPSGDGMTLTEQRLIARPEEYVFRLPATLVISGNVVDAETRQPIKSFRVTPGVRSSPTHMNWVPSQTFSGSDGHFQARETYGYLAYQFRIEADGYLPADSRDIESTEGNVTIDFALKRGKNIIAKVVTPRNQPAAGAKVALGVAGSQIWVKNGDIDDTSTYGTRLETDDAGRFHFPPQKTAFQLVITHPSGYAHIQSPAEWDRARIIHLEPWARVGGTFRIGKMPEANVPITINVEGLHSYGNDVPSIFTHHETTTGPDGRFVFERVIAGRGRIGRRLILTGRDGSAEETSSCMIAADFPGGNTVHIDLGGSGRAVVGKLQPPDGVRETIRWNHALVVVATEGAEVRPEGVYITATVGRDGRFHIDDAPAGDYFVSARVDREGAVPLLLNGHRLIVPPTKEGESAQRVDVGTLTLQKP
jgi:alkaline phosphatase